MPGTKPKVDGAEIQQPKEQTKKKKRKKKKKAFTGKNIRTLQALASTMHQKYVTRNGPTIGIRTTAQELQN